MRQLFPALLVLATSVPTFAAVDTQLLALTPAGAKIISGVDVNRAKSSPFGQYILSKINAENEDFRHMIQETGFDPRRDVEDVLFVSTGSASSDNPQFGVLVRGNFDQDRIRKSLLAKGATVQKYQGVDLLVDGTGRGQHAFAFPDVDIAVAGDLGTVQQMIANRANPTTLDPALQQLVTNIGGNHDAWFVSSQPGAFLSNHFSQETHQRVEPAALQSVLESSGGILFGDAVQLSFDAVTRSPKDATSLADVMRLGASMLQMQREKDPRAGILASSVDNMILKTDGAQVHVSLSIPESGMEQLAELKGQHRAGGPLRSTRQSVR